MGKKVKEYFKGKNPYLMISAAIVIISVIIISMILKDELAAGKDASIAEVQKSTETIEAEFEEVTESEIEDISVEESLEQEPDCTEEIALEETETLGGAESEQIGSSAPEDKSQEQLEGAAVSSETAESEKVPAQYPAIEVEETLASDDVQDTKQEDMIPQESGGAVLDATSVPDVEETPEKVAESEIIPEPETTPELEETRPENEIPAIHEHSWVFESFYQKPTCSNGGLVNQICAHCGETQTTVGTPTGEHQFVVETVGDCCSAEVVICSECNHREVREKDPDNHIDEEDGFCYGCGCKTE